MVDISSRSIFGFFHQLTVEHAVRPIVYVPLSFYRWGSSNELRVATDVLQVIDTVA